MEAGLFTLRFVITGMSTKKAAEVCNTTEKTYKKWESTRIYPVDALELIRANAHTGNNKPCEYVAVAEVNGGDRHQQEIQDTYQRKVSNIVKFPD